MTQCAISAASPPTAEPLARVPLSQACGDLLDLLRGVSDGHCDQGRDHPVATVLALATAATVAGMTGYTAIASWIADVPAQVLTDLYPRAGAVPARPPGKTTIWRVLSATDADALDNVIGTWLTGILLPSGDTDYDRYGSDTSPPGLAHLRLDGKAVRGATDGDGNQHHLLAVMIDPPDKAVVAAQAEVDGAKPHETITVRDLLARLDLTGTVLTADALHTVKATAEQIHRSDFILPVTENRETLLDALNALPWRQVPIAHTSTDTGHGRITTHTIQVLPAPPDLPFSHTAQAWLIERHATAPNGTPISAVAQLGVTSLPPDLADPADLARYNRHHWDVEVLHWIRDTLFREDHCRIRARNGPRVMAALHNLAIGALRLAGRTDITEATRWTCRNMTRPFTILGLTKVI